MSHQPKKIVIIDYALGNLFSLRRALSRLGYESIISSNQSDVHSASHILLPGVGAFGDGMKNLSERNLLPEIKKFTDSGRPLLGICLGMQLLMTESEEFGRHEGLDLIHGRVVRFQDHTSGVPYKIPNIGWRSLEYPTEKRIHWNETFLNGVHEGDCMYFVHSYKVVPQDNSHCLAVTNYAEGKYCSVIAKNNVLGCQFHPEKSGGVGLKILSNFLNL